ncbi:MAG TPA: hypothetical protein VHK06_03415 [Candidatus Limnocylindria bacterium]|nr:hypothetical protein [Candidatus Limnocylindria bacterium]
MTGGVRLRVPRLLSVGAALGLGVLFVAPIERYLFMGWGYGVVAAAGAVGIAALVTMPRAHPLLAFGPLVALGRISYGLYLIQQPILKELRAADVPEVVGLTLSVVAAALMYRFVERPFLGLKGRLRGRRTVRAVGTVTDRRRGADHREGHRRTAVHE